MNGVSLPADRTSSEGKSNRKLGFLRPGHPEPRILPNENPRIPELVYRLTTEGQAPGAQAAAVGLGVFIGCIPLFGSHIFIVLLVASLARLSRVRMYAATWVSNPVLAPALVWAELQVGHMVLHGRMATHSLQQLSELGVGGFGWALAVGSMVLGAVLGIAAAAVVWAWIPKGIEATQRRHAIEAAARRYLDIGIFAWLKARSVLYGNPHLADMAVRGDLAQGTSLVDLGCGEGALLALLLETKDPGPPVCYIGVTSISENVARARRVLQDEARVEFADPTTYQLPPADVVVVWKSRRRIAPVVNDRLARRLRTALTPNGILVISWPQGRLTGNSGETVDKRLRSLGTAGFSIERVTRSTSWFGRWNMIVARA
ncbi:MAG: DUF2062 domain-containing protein [Thermoanaerobaculales bacterium]